MKKMYCLFVLFFILFSQFQVGTLYAADLQELNDKKVQSIQLLDAVGDKMESVVDTLDSTLDDSERSEQLEEKGQEIDEYLQQVQQEIIAETDSSEITEKLQEVQKVVVLKVVSGITEYEDIEDTISSDVAETVAEKEQALEVMQDSLENEQGEYSLILSSKLTQEKIIKTLSTLEKDIAVDFLYQVGEQRYFEVSFPKNSLFSQEMMGDIENNILPESFIGIEVVQPEVFAIESEQSQETLLQGEDLTQTWGIQEYQVFSHLPSRESESSKLRVGVVDTGIDYNHPDLKDNVLVNAGRDFVNNDEDAMDDQGHGTHVAGTIAASINKTGIIGVNPYVKLVPLKICSETGFCPSYAVIKALNYAKTEDIDILNMSLGGRAIVDGHPICDGISDYTSAGGIVVAASGNANIDASEFVPGGCADVITVGAHDQNNQRASFSNYGTKVDLTAPGVDIYSSRLGGGYLKLSGTSMATPHVAGLVSLMQAYDSDITLSQARSGLKEYSNPSVLLTSYTQESVEIAVEVENSDEQEEKVDVSTLNPDISFVGDNETGNATGGSGSNIAQLPNTLELSISERPDGVELSSDAQKINISERFIDTPLPEFYETPELIIFDEESYVSKENTGVIINSLTADLQDVEVSQEHNSHILDGSEDIINNQENTQEDLVEIPSDAIVIPELVEQISTPSPSSHSQQNPIKINGLPELENGVEINSANQEFQPVEIQSYSDLFPENIPETQEAIQINSFPQETSSGTLIDEVVVGDIFKENNEDVDLNQLVGEQVPLKVKEIPVHIEFPDDGDDEEKEYIIDDSGEDGVSINFVRNIVLNVGETYPTISDRKSWKISQVSDDSSIAKPLLQYSAYRYRGSVLAQKAGTTEFRYYYRGSLAGTLLVTVISPIPIEDVDIENGQEIQVPTTGSGPYTFEVSEGGFISANEKNGNISVYGLKKGYVELTILNNGIPEKQLNINVIGADRVVTIAVGEEYYTVGDRDGKIAQTIEDTNILSSKLVEDPQGSRETYYVIGKNPGFSKVSTYERYSQLQEIIGFKVIEPLKRTINLGDSVDIILGESGNYTHSVSNGEIVSTSISGNTISVTGLYGGESQIEIRDGEQVVQIIQVTVLPPIVEMQVKIGEEYYQNFPDVTYSVNQVSQEGIILNRTFYASNDTRLLLLGIKIGTTDIAVYENGNFVKIFRINVIDNPTKRIKLHKGQIVKYQHSDYRDRLSSSDSNVSEVINTGNNYYQYFTAKKEGDFELHISRHKLQDTINIYTVVDEPFPAEQITLVAGSGIPFDYDTSNVSMSIQGVVIHSATYDWLVADNIGTTKVFIKEYGYIVRELDITVIPPAVPIQEINMTQYLPGDSSYEISFSRANEYTYVMDDPSALDINATTSDLRIRGNKSGSFDVALYYKDLYVTTITVHVKSYTRQQSASMSLYDTDRNHGFGYQYALPEAYKYTYSVSNPGIININQASQDLFFTPLKEGTTEIYIRKDGYHLRTMTFTVTVPQAAADVIPKILKTCETQEDGRCNVYLGEDFGLKFTYSNPGIIQVNTSPDFRDGIIVTGEEVGTTSLYIYKGEQHHYTLDVIVSEKEKPVERYLYCTIEQGGSCQVYLEDAIEYNYISTQRGIFDADLTQNTIEITGKAVGESKLYIYDTKTVIGNGGIPETTNSYYYTIYVDVETPADPLSANTSDISLSLGETYDLYMTSGNGDYGMYLDDPDMMSYKLSGEVFSMKALKAGTTTMSITDSTNRTITMNVTIRKELELDERELTIELGESGYLHLVKGSERYGVEKNNNNVEVYRTNDETFEVKAFTLGTTAIQITDEFDNGTTANITVVEKGAGSAGGGEQEEEGDDESSEEKDDLDKKLEEVFEKEDFIDFISYIESEENISITEIVGENIEINGLVNDATVLYDEYKYDNSWDNFASNFADFFINHSSAYDEDSREILESFVRNYKDTYFANLSTLDIDTLIYKQSTSYSRLSQKVKSISTSQYPLDTYSYRLRAYNLYSSINDIIYYSYEKRINEYYEENPEEFAKKQQETLGDIGDVLGVQNTGEGIAALVTYWYGVIADDPYLEQAAKEDLYIALDGLKGDVNPIVRLKRLKKLFELVKKGDNLLEWQKIQKKAKIDGMDLTDHASQRILNSKGIGIPYEQVLDTFKNGTKYWNPDKSQYVIVKGNIALPLSQTGNGKVTSVIQDVTESFKNKLIIK